MIVDPEPQNKMKTWDEYTKKIQKYGENLIFKDEEWALVYPIRFFCEANNLYKSIKKAGELVGMEF
jgi:hypothetical protein